MKATPIGLDLEAIRCSEHPDMDYLLISLQKNAPKRLFCIECFDRNNTVSNLTSLRKVISPEAIAQYEKQNQKSMLETSQDMDSTLKSALEEVDQSFELCIEHLQSIQSSVKRELTLFLTEKLPNTDVISQQLDNLTGKLRNTLNSFSKDHKLEDGPELESYLESFSTLESLDVLKNFNVLFDGAREKVKKILQDTEDQLDSLKNSANKIPLICKETFERVEKGEDLTGDGKLIKVINKEGVGERPRKDSTVTLSFVGAFPDGRKINPCCASCAEGETRKYRLNTGWLTKAFNIGVSTMRVGEQAKFTVHPDLAYGNRTVDSIPPGSTLIFDVELISFE